MPLLSPPLTRSEVEWLLKRRDKVVQRINDLIEERNGEASVLFDDGS